MFAGAGRKLKIYFLPRPRSYLCFCFSGIHRTHVLLVPYRYPTIIPTSSTPILPLYLKYPIFIYISYTYPINMRRTHAKPQFWSSLQLNESYVYIIDSYLFVIVCLMFSSSNISYISSKRQSIDMYVLYVYINYYVFLKLLCFSRCSIANLFAFWCFWRYFQNHVNLFPVFKLNPMDLFLQLVNKL